ncbi:MAG TPA: hypothetical protein VGW57_00385 [Chthoniobacterales bacterium]|nr:hypothetical protein [Chthoniobacterales bacterium]
MPIKLPNLAETDTIRLIACGSIEAKQKSLRTWLNQRRALISSYKVANRAYFVRCATGGFSGHFHLECAAPGAFTSRPKANTRLKDIDALSEKVLGLPIKVRLTCYFLVPIASLGATGIIRTLSADTTAAGVSMKLTAGTLALSGSPIQSVRWELEDDARLVRIAVVTLRKRILAEDYLIEAQQWSRSLFDVMIMARGVSRNG